MSATQRAEMGDRDSLPDRADEIARAYRQSYLLNVTLAVVAKTDDVLRIACNAAEKEFAAALRTYGDEKLEEAYRAIDGSPHGHVKSLLRSLKSTHGGPAHG